MAEKSTESTAKSSTTAEKANENDVTTEEAQAIPGLTRAADVDEAPTGSKAYRSDRAYAEVDANEVVYLDPKSEVGKRLLATGSFTEVKE